MTFTSKLRNFYRHNIHSQILDKIIYKILDTLTYIYCFARQYYFPANYIRRWKLDMLWGLYEPETFDLFKKIIKPGMIIVDVGAHIGYFTRIFSKLTGNDGAVYAFEADPENFEVLKKNSKHLKNIKIQQLAITDHAGMIDFYHCEEKMGCHSILPNIPLDYPKTKISVEATDLDSFLANSGVEKIDLIKIDIEGGEVKAMTGMKNTLNKNTNLIIIVEFAPRWLKAAGLEPFQFLKNLADFNFKIHAITGGGLEKINTDDPHSADKYFDPHNTNAFNEFINLYCVKN